MITRIARKFARLFELLSTRGFKFVWNKLKLQMCSRITARFGGKLTRKLMEQEWKTLEPIAQTIKFSVLVPL